MSVSVLSTNAEKLADEVRNLPNFRGVSLPDIKERVDNLLSMIGREGIFSTYTKHDISHIESMLYSLDWLIPESTQKTFTSVDWLLIVLTVYFHDLGMLVMKEEYNQRDGNSLYVNFRNLILEDPSGKDYLSRAKELGEDEKERFFYQEFVRKNHATRIKEWITGRVSHYWGEGIQKVANEISSILDRLPSRFKENLACVCESHHSNNLDKNDLFPLCQKYGNHRNEMANVQYAALLLRTADLIHVTKDRTPSEMYKIIGLTDPLGVDEWKKQLGTFSVNMLTRQFDQQDKETHYISLSADFSEERPFFSLTEYLVYANSEIEQTKRWADASQESTDAKDYYFPWRGIKPDIRVEGNEPKLMKFNLDRGKLLDLLVGHTIYNDPTVAIRELLQNGIDAVRFQYYLESKRIGDKAIIGHVKVFWNNSNRELVVHDNGIGMNLKIITEHLMKVGSSYYNTTQFKNDNSDFTPISRFGIGVLSCFMISDDIEIITKRGQGPGYRIRMSSVHADYLLKEIPEGDPLLKDIGINGTKITMRLRSSVDLDKKNVLDIIKHWITLPPCDVEYIDNELKTPIKIGFDSVADVLNHYLSDGQRKTKVDYEIITRKKVIEKETYELAFAVRSNSFEKIFYPSNRNSIPKVCIEGIRTGENLPGFYLHSERSICAVLSVSGNGKFRTTVSRADLEEDEEFNRVALMCAEMLFSHVEEEVQEVSTRKGTPLSRSSTAGQWIYESLKRSVSNRIVREYLDSLFHELPLVVIEERTSSDGANNKKLVSQNELNIYDSFWTIESRLVDNLGVISRDIGRELNFNEFLDKFAKGVLSQEISPIVFDPQYYSRMILNTHQVDFVEFSRQYQHTLVKWKKREEVSVTESWVNFVTDNISEISALLESTQNRRYPFKYSYILNKADIIHFSEFEGDLESIEGITTRLVCIIRKGTDLEAKVKKLIDFLNLKLNELIQNDESLRKIAVMVSLYTFFIDSLFARNRIRNEFNNILSNFRDYDRRNSEIEWFLDEIEALNVNEGWFDASDYWRDWSRSYHDSHYDY
jgi:molecular chaperone HtpG